MKLATTSFRRIASTTPFRTTIPTSFTTRIVTASSLRTFVSTAAVHQKRQRTNTRRAIQNKMSAGNHSNNSWGYSALYLVGAYAVGINVFAAGLFWYDKKQAETGGWRVRERDLQLTALLGGWVGGPLAMRYCKHKTNKKSFLVPYAACAAVNMAALGACAYFVLSAGRAASGLISSIMKAFN